MTPPDLLEKWSQIINEWQRDDDDENLTHEEYDELRSIIEQAKKDREELQRLRAMESKLIHLVKKTKSDWDGYRLADYGAGQISIIIKVEKIAGAK